MENIIIIVNDNISDILAVFLHVFRYLDCTNTRKYIQNFPIIFGTGYWQFLGPNGIGIDNGLNIVNDKEAI